MYRNHTNTNILFVLIGVGTNMVDGGLIPAPIVLRGSAAYFIWPRH